jgi:hypothetical protein
MTEPIAPTPYSYQPGSGTRTAGNGEPGTYVVARSPDGFVEVEGRAEDARWHEGAVEVFARGIWWRMGSRPFSHTGKDHLGFVLTYLVDSTEPVNA